MEDPAQPTTGTVEVDVDDAEETIQICAILQEERDSLEADIKQLQEGDSYCKQLCSRKLPRSFMEQNGILYKEVEDRGKIYKATVIPKDWETTVLAQMHDNLGHQGFHRTYAITKRLYYWQGY